MPEDHRHRRIGAWRHRHPGQQRRLPDGSDGWHHRDHNRAVRPGDGTNLYAMFWLCKAAIPHMEPGSTIINTSSVQAVTPSPELLDYATTKAGIHNFTRGLGLGLAEKGIRVNAVAPGPIWTPLIPATMPTERAESHGQKAPLGRAGQPAEVAPAYVFFASQESSYVTAEMLGVTGGMPVS